MKLRTKIPATSVLIVLFAISIILFCICCIGFVAYNVNNEATQTKDYMLDVSKKSAIAVNDKLDGYISSLCALSAAISCYPDNSEYASAILSSQLKQTEFRRVGYVYTNGESYIADNKLGELSGVDFRNREYYQEAIKGNVFISAPFDDYWTGTSIIMISVPIYDETKMVIGALCGMNSATTLTTNLEESCSESNMYFHIVDGNGNIVVHSTYVDVTSTNIFETNYEKTTDFDVLKEDFATGGSGVASFKEYGKGEKYVAYTPLKTKDWYFCYITPTQFAQLRVNKILGYAASLLILLATTIISAFILFAKIRQNYKIERIALSFTDKLTGYSNAAKFIYDLQTADNIYDGNHFIVLYDVQNFRAYNELFGYAAGDDLIVSVGKAIKDNINGNELCARYYAEQFLILFNTPTEFELKKRISNIFNAIDTAIAQNNMSGYSLISRCGIYKIKPQDKKLSLNSLIDYANQARLTIHDIHKSSFKYFDEETSMALKEATKLEVYMQTALDNNEFLLYLQPKYAIQGSSAILCGAESLVRWNYKNEGVIPPDKFIPLFEKNGFVIELDMYMLEQSCRAIRKWLDMGKKCVPISVNQSRLHMFSDTYLAKILEITNKYNIPHELIELEITESVFMNDINQVRKQFSQIRELGFKTSMDDFGSGFSSMNLLKDIEADTIKIDKGFFGKSFLTANGKYIIKSMVLLAKGLSFNVIAEGVETKDEVDFLKKCGCDAIQGYFYGKPQPLSVFEDEHFEPFQNQNE